MDDESEDSFEMFRCVLCYEKGFKHTPSCNFYVSEVIHPVVNFHVEEISKPGNGDVISATVVDEETETDSSVLATFYGPKADEWASDFISRLPGFASGRYGIDVVRDND